MKQREIDIGRETAQEKTHYKLYKAKKHWLVAGITMFGLGLATTQLNTTHAAENDAETNTTTAGDATQTSNTAHTAVLQSTKTATTAAKTTTPVEAPATTTTKSATTTTTAQTPATTAASTAETTSAVKTAVQSETDAKTTTESVTAAHDAAVAALKAKVIATGATWTQSANGAITIDLPAGTDPAAMRQTVSASGITASVKVTAKAAAAATTDGSDTTTATATTTQQYTELGKGSVGVSDKPTTLTK